MKNKKLYKEKYRYKGRVYKVIGLTKFKHPEKRIWVDAVLYQDLEKETLWTREIQEFFDRFVPDE